MSLCISLKFINAAFFCKMWFVSINIYHIFNAASFAGQVKEGVKFTGPEKVREAAQGCARIRGDTLGIVGLGEDLDRNLFEILLNETEIRLYLPFFD